MPLSWLSSRMSTTSSTLITDIVCRGLQDLLEADVSAVIGGQQYQRSPEASHLLQRFQQPCVHHPGG